MTQERSSVYRGETRELAEAAYHADAHVMAKMGFAPAAEDWSSVMQEVLTVRYVYAPELEAAVLRALAEAEVTTPTPVARPSLVSTVVRNARQHTVDFYERQTPDQKISIGAITGMAIGIALWWLLGSLFVGDDPFLLFVSMIALGLAGLLLGALRASR